MNKSFFSTILLSMVAFAGSANADEPAKQEQQQPVKESADSKEAAAVSAAAEETPAAKPAELELQDLPADQIALLSEAFGHMLAKHIQTLGINFDVAQLVKGLQDANDGKPSPMDEMKCLEAIGQARQQSFLRMAKKNLQDAEAFLQQTATKDGVQKLEDGKLYFKIEKEGEGAAVAAGNTPLIRYKGSFLDGKVFGASKEDDLVMLDETIPGFSRGLLGMKEGEKRTLYIHPELGYGTSGQLPPNSLLVFEIELVKANSETGKSQSVTSTTTPQTEIVEKEISQNEAPAASEESKASVR